MQGVCFESVEVVSFRDLPDVQTEAACDAVVRVRMSGLCGSDLHPFFGRESGLDRGTVMGHEMAGEVVDVGSEVTGFSVGDSVFVPFSTNCGTCFYCQCGLTSRCTQSRLFGWVANGDGLEGCQSSLVRVPLADATLKHVPDGLSDESALLLGDNLSTGYYCAEMAMESSRLMSVPPEDLVLAVIGCGTVGQLGIIAARSMGVRNIVAVDPIEHRRDAAEAIGATPVAPDNAVGLIESLTGGRGADAVMELVGLPDAQKLAYESIRPGGTMSVIGCHCTAGFSFSPVDAYDKNLVYKTGRCPARHYMDKLTARVASGEFDLSPFVTHRFDAKDCVEAYDVFAHRRGGCVKAVLVW